MHWLGHSCCRCPPRHRCTDAHLLPLASPPAHPIHKHNTRPPSAPAQRTHRLAVVQEHQPSSLPHVQPRQLPQPRQHVARQPADHLHPSLGALAHRQARQAQHFAGDGGLRRAAARAEPAAGRAGRWRRAFPGRGKRCAARFPLAHCADRARQGSCSPATWLAQASHSGTSRRSEQRARQPFSLPTQPHLLLAGLDADQAPAWRQLARDASAPVPHERPQLQRQRRPLPRHQALQDGTLLGAAPVGQSAQGRGVCAPGTGRAIKRRTICCRILHLLQNPHLGHRPHFERQRIPTYTLGSSRQNGRCPPAQSRHPQRRQ